MGEGLEGLGRSRLGLLEGELDEDADLAAHVDVAGERTGLGLTGGEARELHVLTDDVDELGETGLDGLTVHVGGEEGVEIGGLGGDDGLGDLGGEVGELRVGRDEVGLAGDLDQGAGAAVLGDAGGDGALVGGAASLLGGGGQAVLAHDVDGEVDVPVSLDEGLLRLHHGGAGHVAELLDHSGGDLGHETSFLRVAVNERT